MRTVAWHPHRHTVGHETLVVAGSPVSGLSRVNDHYFTTPLLENPKSPQLSREKLEHYERPLKLVTIPTHSTELPNLERSAKLLEDLPVLWAHPEVTHEQREELGWEVFQRITIDGKEFMSIEPNAPYAPFFASIVTSEEFGYWDPNSPPSPPQTTI